MMRKFLFLIPMLLMVVPAFADSQGSATGGTRGTQSTLMGCTYNASAPTLSSGQQVGLQCNNSGSINVSGSITATNPSVGTNAVAAPTSSTQIGTVDGSGNLQPASTTNPVPVSAANSAIVPLGATNDSTCATATGTCTLQALIKFLNNAVTSDPCGGVKSYADFESSSSGGSIITAASSKKAYLCSITITTSTAANVSLTEGTGSSVCTGGTTAGVYLNTGTTAANGASFAANGGVQAGNGLATIAANATANQNICVVFTTTNTPQVNVHVAYVQQ